MLHAPAPPPPPPVYGVVLKADKTIIRKYVKDMHQIYRASRHAFFFVLFCFVFLRILPSYTIFYPRRNNLYTMAENIIKQTT